MCRLHFDAPVTSLPAIGALFRPAHPPIVGPDPVSQMLFRCHLRMGPFLGSLWSAEFETSYERVSLSHVVGSWRVSDRVFDTLLKGLTLE